jgi:probable rRNA maturation factor
MIRKPRGGEVAVSNRQRRLKINASLLVRIVERALELLHDDRAGLGIVLMGDDGIAKLNAQYHNTQGPTDVLSFDYGEGQGELIISTDHVIAQARRFRSTPSRELVLYVVHGIFHLRGHNDVVLRDRRRMRAAERRLMSRLARDFKFQTLVARRVARH